MILRRAVSLLLVLALLPWAAPVSHAEWEADTNDKLQRRAAQAIENMRDQVKVIVGGAPITQEWADQIGADGFALDAASAADRCKELVAA